jgi:hypothetical protein
LEPALHQCGCSIPDEELTSSLCSIENLFDFRRDTSLTVIPRIGAPGI